MMFYLDMLSYGIIWNNCWSNSILHMKMPINNIVSITVRNQTHFYRAEYVSDQRYNYFKPICIPSLQKTGKILRRIQSTGCNFMCSMYSRILQFIQLYSNKNRQDVLFPIGSNIFSTILNADISKSFPLSLPTTPFQLQLQILLSSASTNIVKLPTTALSEHITIIS